MKKRSFACGAIILAVCSILAKLLGGVYRIALTSALGAEGIGYYQLVFPFFALALAISSNAIPVTLSRQISGELALGKGGSVRWLMKKALIYAIAAGFVGMIFTIALSRLMSSAQSQAGVYICYIAISPAIVFVAVANVFKGWFLGHGNTTPAGISQIVEVVAKLAIGLLIVGAMQSQGLMQAVAGGLLAVSISEFISLLVVFIWYLAAGKEERRLKAEQSDSRFFATFLPITASGLIFPFIAFIDSIMVVNLLNFGGHSNAVSQYGILTGPVASLINMPIVLAMSISVAIVPAIASAMSGYDVVSVKSKTASSIKMCLMISMPFFVGAILASASLTRLLYPTLDGGQKDLTSYLLAVMSVNIIVLSLLEVLNAVLQGIGRLRPVLINIAIGGVVKIILELILVPRFGIVASGLSTIAFYLIALVLNGAQYNTLVGKNLNLFKSISKILLSGAIMSLSIIPTVFITNDVLALIYTALAGGSVYFISLLLTRAVDEREVAMLPLGNKLSRLLSKLGYFKERKNYDNGSGVGMP
ncbi:MAG: polysaccharide biosynthesis protein [Clostridia bacterium]|nr:polysaccharide biosynthesis protein [Clostridia bacterium]MDE7079073.1 polysaccharide biosynthesis protein [Clostridia bacterium]